ncbi:hypothetical protein [Flavobacterium mesophilum]|uniref:hypothetical protein n=1 Tax=Flavobacterium mesophilum TaxID=3143495 RepID=UPI0031DAFCEB
MKMTTLKDQKDLLSELGAIDRRIHLLNDRKIAAFFEFLGLHQRDDVPKDYLKWEEILIVVPDRHVSNAIKKYRYSIERISFLTNPNAEKIHIFDAKEYRAASQNKTQFQIRQMLRNSFGGARSPFGEN